MSTESVSSLRTLRSPALTVSICASVNSPSKTEFCTQCRWRLRNLCTFVTRATSTSYTSRTYITQSLPPTHLSTSTPLPPGAEARIRLDLREVLDQLVAFEPDQTLVAHLAPQTPVLN